MSNPLLITSAADKCKECYHCVRVCPVKAIKIEPGNATVLADRCISCGQCLNACALDVFSLETEVEAVMEMLRGDTPVVAVLAPEYSVAWPGRNFADVVRSMLNAGFHSVEDSSLADEMVAAEYHRMAVQQPDRLLLRSTCPAIVNLVQIYHPELCEYLAPIASSMAVAGRYTRRLYTQEVKVVYIGPCMGRKTEKHWYGDSPIDAVLTFAEVDDIIRRVTSRPGSSISGRGKVDPLDKRVVVERTSVDFLDNGPVLANASSPAALTRDYPDFASSLEILLGRNCGGFLDALGCRGCAASPQLDSRLDWQERQRLMFAGDNDETVVKVPFEQIMRHLPKIDLSRSFTANPVPESSIRAPELDQILRDGHRFDSEDRLDCGACGYQTCKDLASAIHQGRASWTACFPLQKNHYEQHTAELREASRTDSLTELLNHRGFMERLHEEAQRAKRYHLPMSLIMIDVDRFKYINDTYGHVGGDRVLELLAQVLRITLRETDIAARYGGDEFAIILPQTSENEAMDVAEKLRAKVEQSRFYVDADHDERLTLSLGICEIGSDINDPVVILSKADRAMYTAKKNGRNRVSRTV